MRTHGDPSDILRNVLRITELEPSRTVRDEEQVRMQAFSTPLGVAHIMQEAAAVRPNDRVLEPSAGTGTLAVGLLPLIDRGKGGGLHLNELSARRAEILRRTFDAGTLVTEFDGHAIHEHTAGGRPTLIIMNPPFSKSAAFRSRRHNADLEHVRSAFRALIPGGRLVALTSSKCRPGDDAWRAAFDGNRESEPLVRYTTPVAGRLYTSRGTTFETRLTVLDSVPRGRTDARPATKRTEPAETEEALLTDILGHLPDRLEIEDRPPLPFTVRPAAGPPRTAGETPPETAAETPPPKPARRKRRRAIEYKDQWGPAAAVSAVDRAAPGAESLRPNNTPFSRWSASAVLNIEPGPHPTQLVESTSMASVRHVLPQKTVHLPASTIENGILSDAQIESILLASAAHEQYLDGLYVTNADWSLVRRAKAEIETLWDDTPGDEAEKHRVAGEHAASLGIHAVSCTDDADPNEKWSAPVRMRRGWMLGDGTGTGKGRQVAGIISDRWIRGARRALWVSQSETLIEDAQRDWSAVGGNPEEIFSIRRYRANDRIDRRRGILFTTYASLRSGPAAERRPRLEQIIEWLAGSVDADDRRACEAVIVFDEAHAMANAAGSAGSRGPTPPSQQGLTSMRLQNALPNARVVYVSATGASTVDGLAYANRLALWTTDATPFETREDFVDAMNGGGIAALEVMSRDMKALGLYQSRALAYDGVETCIIRHEITDEQRKLYDDWTLAFRMIHQNLNQALEASNITDGVEGTLNKQQRSAATSRFESIKQRFFNHMLCALKLPTVLKYIRRDLDDGYAPVVQLVSTGEALTNRRLAEIPASEWDDLHIDITPREYVLEYLEHAFPTTLYEKYEAEGGAVLSRPKFDDDGNPVKCGEALELKQKLLEKLAGAPSLPGALDTIVQHFGTEQVAEVSGRKRRIVKTTDSDGRERYSLETRPPAANLNETAAFQDGDKSILVFTLAGNTGRSYHADINAGNTRRRRHYLLEAGWRPDQAIQGLGRTHRTHQSSAPVFLPVTTNIKGERRFISTIAARLAALGAITRGQRDSQSAMTESGELFRPEDNLESEYAHTALRQLFRAIEDGAVENWNGARFQEATGLTLTTRSGELKQDLPRMAQTLNRLLALPIAEQNELFAELEKRIDKNIEDAKAAGTYDHGVEELNAISITVKQEVPVPDADMRLVELAVTTKLDKRTAEDARWFARIEESLTFRRKPALVVNELSGRAAVASEGPMHVPDDGPPVKRVRLTRPGGIELLADSAYLTERSRWRVVPEEEWEAAWNRESDLLPSDRTDSVWLACGTLLPLWDLFPKNRPRVYRAVTDGGRTVRRAHASGRRAGELPRRRRDDDRTRSGKTPLCVRQRDGQRTGGQPEERLAHRPPQGDGRTAPSNRRRRLQRPPEARAAGLHQRTDQIHPPVFHPRRRRLRTSLKALPDHRPTGRRPRPSLMPPIPAYVTDGRRSRTMAYDPASRQDFALNLTFVAGLALARCPGLRTTLDIQGPIQSAEQAPPELQTNAVVRRGVWAETMRDTEKVVKEMTAAMRRHYTLTEVRPDLTEEQRQRAVAIRTRKAVELLAPANTAPMISVICQGRPGTSWTTLYNHPLSEVRAVAAKIRELPTGPDTRPDGGLKRPSAQLPAGFNEEAAVDAFRAATRRTAARVDRRTLRIEPDEQPTVDMIRTDAKIDTMLAAGALYEYSRLPFALALKETRDRLTPDERLDIHRETAANRRWSDQPPDRALSLFRADFEITCTGLAWLVLSNMASRTGATVLMQSLGVCGGAIKPCPTISETGLENLWQERMDAHRSLWENLANEDTPDIVRQYALTQGHFCRGVISTTGDRLVRIIDWLVSQRGPARSAKEMRSIGHQLFSLLTRISPEACQAVVQGQTPIPAR